MPQTSNVIICGVGGQGVILISQILGNAAVRDGLSVKGSEIHGMAARGGAVASHLRIGDETLGPVNPLGKCDILLGMEPAEALRNAFYLAPTSTVILNTQKIFPFTVSLGRSQYPELDRIIRELKNCSEKIVPVDAAELAAEAGNPIASNIVMIGELFGSNLLPISLESVQREIRDRFGEKASELNIKAFNLGYNNYK